MLDWFLHGLLRRPYSAACTIDEGQGSTVVLLHGLASTSEVWRPLADLLQKNHRVLAFDLLGFGVAAKPGTINYSVEDHTYAVLACLKKQHVTGPIVIVGHSMGCLVAVHIARLRPDLVQHLVLYELPLYTENPVFRRHAMLQRMYFAAYKRVLKHPNYSPANARMVQKLAARIAGFQITKQTWVPFVKSLQNTVMTQTTAEDIKRLTIPIDIIFGSHDVVVRPGIVQAVFGEEATNIRMHTIASHHTISLVACEFIAAQIAKKY